MYRDERPAHVLGLEGSRDLLIWRCPRDGCGRYFYGTVGYGYCSDHIRTGAPSPRCTREDAFLVVQRALSLYICPVAGYKRVQVWQDPQRAIDKQEIASQGAELLRELITGRCHDAVQIYLRLGKWPGGVHADKCAAESLD